MTKIILDDPNHENMRRQMTMMRDHFDYVQCMTTNWDWAVLFAESYRIQSGVSAFEDMHTFGMAVKLSTEDPSFCKQMAQHLQIESESDSGNDMTFAWKNHKNGALNPRAQFQKEVSKTHRSPFSVQWDQRWQIDLLDSESISLRQCPHLGGC